MSPAEILSEQENQEEAIKNSQLLNRLQDLQKRQKMLQKITEQVKHVYSSELYFRKTSLDLPPSRFDFEMDEKSMHSTEDDYILNSKLSKEKLIEDQEIKSYFIAFNEHDLKPQILDMRFDDDITRLCRVLLENLTSLKGCLPSDNVEYRLCQRVVQEA